MSIVFFLGTVTCPYPNGPIGPNRPIPGAVTLRPRSRYVTHTQSIFSQLQLRRFLLPEMAGRSEAVSPCVSTHTNSQPGCGCVCVCSGWVSLCLAVSQTATGLGGGAGAPTSRLGQRENTRTIQRCCMRNQCDFGKLHNINLF